MGLRQYPAPPAYTWVCYGLIMMCRECRIYHVPQHWKTNRLKEEGWNHEVNADEGRSHEESLIISKRWNIISHTLIESNWEQIELHHRGCPQRQEVVVSQPQSLSDDQRYVCHPWSKIWKKEKKRWKELWKLASMTYMDFIWDDGSIWIFPK